MKGADAAERARVLEDFWQIKKDAYGNKVRGNQNVYGNFQNVSK